MRPFMERLTPALQGQKWRILGVRKTSSYASVLTPATLSLIICSRLKRTLGIPIFQNSDSSTPSLRPHWFSVVPNLCLGFHEKVRLVHGLGLDVLINS